MKHTPAPWQVSNLETAETVFYIAGQSGSIGSVWNKGGEGEANAKLVAASPALLDALISMTEISIDADPIDFARAQREAKLLIDSITG